MSKKSMREVMPETAKLVDELRAAYGVDLVDGAIAAGQQARREYARREAEHGQEAAQGWLARQKWPNGRFWAAEGDLEIGLKAP